MADSFTPFKAWQCPFPYVGDTLKSLPVVIPPENNSENIFSLQELAKFCWKIKTITTFTDSFAILPQFGDEVKFEFPQPRIFYVGYKGELEEEEEEEEELDDPKIYEPSRRVSVSNISKISKVWEKSSGIFSGGSTFGGIVLSFSPSLVSANSIPENSICIVKDDSGKVLGYSWNGLSILLQIAISFQDQYAPEAYIIRSYICYGAGTDIAALNYEERGDIEYGDDGEGGMIIAEDVLIRKSEVISNFSKQIFNLTFNFVELREIYYAPTSDIPIQSTEETMRQWEETYLSLSEPEFFYEAYE